MSAKPPFPRDAPIDLWIVVALGEERTPETLARIEEVRRTDPAFYGELVRRAEQHRDVAWAWHELAETLNRLFEPLLRLGRETGR